MKLSQKLKDCDGHDYGVDDKTLYVSGHEDHLLHVLLPGLGLRDHCLRLQAVLGATLPPGEPVGVGPQRNNPFEVPLTKSGWLQAVAKLSV